MDRASLLAAYDRQLRIGLRPPEGRLEVLPHLIRTVLPPPRMSYVGYSALAGCDVDAAIDAEIVRFRDHGGPFEWTVYEHDVPADLRTRLAARGFEAGELETVMVLDLERAPERPFAVDPRVREVGAEGLDEVRRVLERVWGEDFGWIPRRLEAHLDIPGYLRVFVAEVAGKAVSAAWVYFQPGTDFAGLYGGSTLEEHRGQGLYGALLAVRAQAARERGYRYLTVDAGPMSSPILARHGFERLVSAWPCIWRPEELPEGSG